MKQLRKMMINGKRSNLFAYLFLCVSLLISSCAKDEFINSHQQPSDQAMINELKSYSNSSTNGFSSIHFNESNTKTAPDYDLIAQWENAIVMTQDDIVSVKVPLFRETEPDVLINSFSKGKLKSKTILSITYELLVQKHNVKKIYQQKVITTIKLKKTETNSVTEYIFASAVEGTPLNIAMIRNDSIIRPVAVSLDHADSELMQCQDDYDKIEMGADNGIMLMGYGMTCAYCYTFNKSPLEKCSNCDKMLVDVTVNPGYRVCNIHGISTEYCNCNNTCDWCGQDKYFCTCCPKCGLPRCACPSGGGGGSDGGGGSGGESGGAGSGDGDNTNVNCPNCGQESCKGCVDIHEKCPICESCIWIQVRPTKATTHEKNSFCTSFCLSPDEHRNFAPLKDRIFNSQTAISKDQTLLMSKAFNYLQKSAPINKMINSISNTNNIIFTVDGSQSSSFYNPNDSENSVDIINILPNRFESEAKLSATLAHEIFHRDQYNFNNYNYMDSNGLGNMEIEAKIFTTIFVLENPFIPGMTSLNNAEYSTGTDYSEAIRELIDLIDSDGNITSESEFNRHYAIAADELKKINSHYNTNLTRTPSDNTKNIKRLFTR